MHSRIFQIEQSPVPSGKFISENDFIEHWFVGIIADYVDGDVSRSEEIEYLLSNLETRKIAHVDRANGSFVILSEGKEAYFAAQYNLFKEARDKTLDLGLSDFAGADGFYKLVWQMENAFCDKYGVYVSSYDADTVPLDEFIRYAALGEPYYIGSVLDYHW